MSREIFPPPLARGKNLADCIQPRLFPGGVWGFGFQFDRRRLVAQWRAESQLMVPSRLFHEAVALDAIQFPEAAQA